MKQSHFVLVISLLAITVCVGGISAQQDSSTDEDFASILNDDKPQMYCRSLNAFMKKICAVKDKIKSQTDKKLGELVFHIGVMTPMPRLLAVYKY